MKSSKLAARVIEGYTVHFRRDAGSTDDRALREVIDRRFYRRKADNFDVEKGERWLDLGANIGAFAVYCRIRGAKAMCFEPDKDNFEILKLNIPKNWLAVRAAVTASKEENLTLYQSPQPGNFYRATVLPLQRYVAGEQVPNYYAGRLKKLGRFDGIKMDIEGSEGPILDEWLLPPAEKLVLEYHTSRDSSAAHLKHRLNQIKKHYKHVHYVSYYDKKLKEGAEVIKTFYDRSIFAWGLK